LVIRAPKAAAVSPTARRPAQAPRRAPASTSPASPPTVIRFRPRRTRWARSGATTWR